MEILKMYESAKILISLLFFMVLWQAFWRRLCLDYFRDKIFELRGNLFDLALDNKAFSFQSPAYRNIENLLNGTIRNGHTIGILQIFIFDILKKLKFSKQRIMPVFVLNLLKSIHDIKNPEVKTSLKRILSKYEKYLMFYLVFSSLPMTIFFIVIMFYYVIKEFFSFLFNRIKFVFTIKNNLKTLFKNIFREFEDQAILQNT